MKLYLSALFTALIQLADANIGNIAIDFPEQPSNVCGGAWENQMRRLKSNMQKFYALSCYRYTFQRTCDCPNDIPHDVVVKDGKLVSPYSVDGIAFAPTMEKVFDIIASLCYAECPKKGPALCRFTFNPDLGYVESFYYDANLGEQGDELTYSIRDFRACNETQK